MREYNFSAPLMGTNLEVILIHDTDPELVFSQMLAFGQKLQQQFSRFIPSSELSRLNQTKNAQVSNQLWKLLQRSSQLYQESQGLFNPLLSPLSLGYDQDFRTHHQHFQNQKTPSNSNWETVVFKTKTKTIQLQPQQTLDFGGFLKGWTAQAMGQFSQKLKGSLINLGGDLYAQGTEINGQAWLVSIDHPLDSSRSLTTHLSNQSLSTSGTYARHWQDKHHILDPQTQDSSQSDLISASVITTDGACADAWATVAVILGRAKAEVFLKEKNLSYALIDTHGKIYSNLT